MLGSVFAGGAVLLAVLSWSAGSALADQDHDRARRLLESGEIMPLEQLLGRIKPGGRVLEVELESEHGRHVYEIEYLDTYGEVHEGYFDARTGEVLSDDWAKD